MCACAYVCAEKVDFGKSDKIWKVSGKVDKPNTVNKFNNDISSLFILNFIVTSWILIQKNFIV